MEEMKNISLKIKLLQKEYFNLINLVKQGDSRQNKKINKNIQKMKDLLKLIEDDKQKLIQHDKDYKEYIKEKKKNEFYLEKESKLSEIVNNANKIMSKDLSFFSLSTNSKKFNTASMSYIDLINLTQRLNRQNNYPKDLQNVYNNPNDIPFAFLGPYPYEDKEMKDSVLKFNLNVKEEQRLKPPVIYPKMEKVNKGDQIKLEYPGYGESMANNSEDQLNPIFFKYILIPEGKKIEEIPSFFTGEVYNKNIGIIIDDNCTLKACSCRIGYKDSQIVHYKFTTSEEKMNLQEKITKPLNHDYIIRPEISSSNANFGNKILGITKNFSSSNQTGNEQNPNESNRSPNRQSNYQYSNYSRDSKSDMFQDDGL